MTLNALIINICFGFWFFYRNQEFSFWVLEKKKIEKKIKKERNRINENENCIQLIF